MDVQKSEWRISFNKLAGVKDIILILNTMGIVTDNKNFVEENKKKYDGIDFELIKKGD